MSDIQEDLRQYLIADANVLALVSTRIYPDVLPLGQTSDSIVLETISSNTEPTIDGTIAKVDTRISVRCYSATKKQASVIAKNVRLDSGLESLKNTTMNSRWIEHVNCEDAHSGQEELPVDGGSYHRYVVVQDYRIAHADDT